MMFFWKAVTTPRLTVDNQGIPGLFGRMYHKLLYCFSEGTGVIIMWKQTAYFPQVWFYQNVDYLAARAKFWVTWTSVCAPTYNIKSKIIIIIKMNKMSQHYKFIIISAVFVMLFRHILEESKSTSVQTFINTQFLEGINLVENLCMMPFITFLNWVKICPY